MKRIATFLTVLFIGTIIFGQNKIASDTIRKKISETKITEGASGVRRSIGYKFNALVTDTDPGNGIFRCNNSEAGKVTWVFVDNIDVSGEDQTNWYSTWDKSTGAAGRGSINIVGQAGKDVILFNITGVFVKANGYWKIPVEFISGNLPSSGATYYYVFNRIAHRKPQPVQEPKPVQEQPAAEVPKPVQEQPAAEVPKPVQEQPVAEVPKPVQEQPVAEVPKPVQEQPVVEVPKPVQEQPAVEVPKPVQEQPVVEVPKPVQEQPVVEVPKPVQEPKPVQDQPETKPVQTGRTAPVKDTGNAPHPSQTTRPAQTTKTETAVQTTQTKTATQTTQPSQPAQPVQQPVQQPQTTQTTQGVRNNQNYPPVQQTQPVQTARPVDVPNPYASVNLNGTSRRKCYRGIIELGYALGIGDYGINNFRFNFINGIMIGRSSSIGLGLGYRRYFENDLTSHSLFSPKSHMPVFLDLRTSFSTRKVTPYLALGIGGSASFVKVNSDSTATRQEGLFFCPSGGIWINVSDRFAVFAGIAYEMQRLEYVLIADDSHFKKNAGSVSLNIGIAF
jgi:hypothetical protein